MQGCHFVRNVRKIDESLVMQRKYQEFSLMH